MELQNQKLEKKKNKSSRISLSQESKRVIDGWKALLENKILGLKVSDADLVNWKITTSPMVCANDVAWIRKMFFDEIKQLQWAIEQVRAAKASGDDVLAAEILRRVVPPVQREESAKGGGMAESVATQLCTLPELSAFLRISRKTIYYWVKRDEIPYIKIGRHLRLTCPKSLGIS